MTKNVTTPPEWRSRTRLSCVRLLALRSTYSWPPKCHGGQARSMPWGDANESLRSLIVKPTPNTLDQFTSGLSHCLMSRSVLDQGYQSGVFVASPADAELQNAVLNGLADRLAAAGALSARVRAEVSPCDDQLEALIRVVGAQLIAGEPFPRQLSDLTRFATLDGKVFVLLIENVDAWMQSSEGVRVLHALKAARDATNLPSGATGKFLVVGIGDSIKVAKLTKDSSQPFYGAACVALPDCTFAGEA